MKRKILALLLAASMAISLAACGGSTSNGEGTGEAPTEETSAEAGDVEEAPAPEEKENKGDITLTLALAGDATAKERLDSILQQYTDETGVNIETIFIGGNWTEFCTKIQTMIGGGDELDLAAVATEGLPKFYDMGILEPIDDWIEANQDVAKSILDETSPAFQEVFKNDGKTYAFPFSFNNVVMHFNTNRLEEAGLELPAGDWDKDEFLKYCEALTTEKDGVKQYAVMVPYGEYFCAEAWLFNNEATYMNDDFTESLINSPESVEMFQLWQDLIYKYEYAPIPEENVSAIAQLINGQIAMGSWGRWPTNNYVADNFEDVAVQYLPNFKVNQQIGGVDGFVTLEASKNKEAAKEFAAWLSQKTFAEQFLSSGNIPANHSLAAEKISELGIPKNYEIFYAGSNTDIYKPVSAPLQFTECSDIVMTAISDICINKADVQSTLDRAAEDMNAILVENK